MPKEKLPDSKSPNEEDEEEDYETAKAKHLVKEYKCYTCGKMETGKKLDDLLENSLDVGWYFAISEVSEGSEAYAHIFHLPLPQPGLGLDRAYCNACGKIRERELELFRIEHRKMKALEGIGSALTSIAAALPSESQAPSMYEVASALNSIASAIRMSSP